MNLCAIDMELKKLRKLEDYLNFKYDPRMFYIMKKRKTSVVEFNDDDVDPFAFSHLDSLKDIRGDKHANTNNHKTSPAIIRYSITDNTLPTTSLPHIHIPQHQYIPHNSKDLPNDCTLYRKITPNNIKQYTMSYKMRYKIDINPLTSFKESNPGHHALRNYDKFISHNSNKIKTIKKHYDYDDKTIHSRNSPKRQTYRSFSLIHGRSNQKANEVNRNLIDTGMYIHVLSSQKPRRVTASHEGEMRRKRKKINYSVKNKSHQAGF